MDVKMISKKSRREDSAPRTAGPCSSCTRKLVCVMYPIMKPITPLQSMISGDGATAKQRLVYGNAWEPAAQARVSNPLLRCGRVTSTLIVLAEILRTAFAAGRLGSHFLRVETDPRRHGHLEQMDAAAKNDDADDLSGPASR